MTLKMISKSCGSCHQPIFEGQGNYLSGKLYHAEACMQKAKRKLLLKLGMKKEAKKQ